MRLPQAVKYCKDEVKYDQFFAKSQLKLPYLRPELSNLSSSVQMKYAFARAHFTLAVYSFHLAVKY